MSETILELDPQTVKPFEDQPRKRFRGIPQLAESIRLVGQVTPGIVTRLKPGKNANGFAYELVDGERRLQACLLGKLNFRAHVQPDVGKDERFAMAIAANFCRQTHDCMEIAQAVQRLRDDGRTAAEAAGIFGKGPLWVSQHQSLLRLPAEVQEMLQVADERRKTGELAKHGSGAMTFSIAQLLLNLEPSRQLPAARRIEALKMSISEARRYVLGIMTPAEKPKRKDSPETRFERMYGAVDACANRLAPIEELPHKELLEILAAGHQRERQRMVEKIEELWPTLMALAETLKRVDR